MTDYALNELLARVAGVEVFPVYQGLSGGDDMKWWAITNEEAHVDGEYVWTPITDNNQMALVKAGLQNEGYDIFSHWEHATQLWFYAVWREGQEEDHKAWYDDKDERRAFAKAVAKMKGETP